MNAKLLPFLGFLLVAFAVGCGSAERDRAIDERNAAIVERDAIIRQRNVAISQKDVAISQRDDAVASLNRAATLIKEREAYIQNLVQQMRSGEVDAETLRAVVVARITGEMTIAEVERILGYPRPPGAGDNDRVDYNRDTFGTVVDAGKFGNKIVMVRHTLYGDAKYDRGTLERMTISVSDVKSQSRHALSFKTFMEFPELDLVVFDVPSSLQATPLPLGEVKSWELPIVSHIYHGEVTFYSQPVQISPFPLGTVFDPPEKWGNVSDNFIRINGRIDYGDSGGPLVANEGGKRIVGFITNKFNDKDGGGTAVKASSLLRKLTELESQRSQ